MIFVGKSYRSRDKMLKVTFAQTTRVLKGHLMKTGGIIAQWFPHLLLHPAAPGSIPSITYFFPEERIVDVPNQLCCFEESGQWLDYVDGTHLVLGLVLCLDWVCRFFK